MLKLWTSQSSSSATCKGGGVTRKVTTIAHGKGMPAWVEETRQDQAVAGGETQWFCLFISLPYNYLFGNKVITLKNTKESRVGIKPSLELEGCQKEDRKSGRTLTELPRLTTTESECVTE